MNSKGKDRRQFLKDLGWRTAGLATAVGALGAVNIDPTKDREKVGNAILRRPLIITPDEVANAFICAERGTLMLYYQLFFPTYLNGNEVEQVKSLYTYCKNSLKSNKTGRELTRLRALPAVAAAHALAGSNAEEADGLRLLILDALDLSLNLDVDPNREVTEIIWRTINAVLWKTPHTWETFEAGSPLVQAARKTCSYFLNDTDETLPLLNPASSAWQFLITYQRSLQRRPAAIDLPAVNDAIAHIQSLPSTRNNWLHGLTKLYAGRMSYEQMLPQSFEIVIGRSCLAPDSPNHEAADYFLLLGLEMWHIINRVASGELVSRFMPDIARAAQLTKDIPTFYGNYGVRKTDWEALKHSHTARFFSPYAIAEIDALFHKYDQTFSSDPFQKGERSMAYWLAKQVPFRHLEEYNAATKACTLRGLMLAFIGTGRSADLRYECLKKPVDRYIETANTGSGQNEIEDARIKLEGTLPKCLEGPIQDERIVAQFGLLDEASHSELVQRKIFPARPGLAGEGVVRAPVERSQMTTKKPKRTLLSRSEAFHCATMELLNYGDRISIAPPTAKKQGSRMLWISPLGIWISKTKWFKLGEVVVDGKTGKVLKATKRRELLVRLRAIPSS